MSLKRKTLKVISLLLVIILSISIMTPALAEETEPTWTTVAPMVSRRQTFASAVVNGNIYVFGGLIDGKVEDVAEKYDPLTGKWTTLAPVPKAIGYPEAVAVDGMIYLVGGWTPDGAQYGCFIYNPVSNKWTTKSIKTRRVNHQVAVVNGKIYVIGGEDSQKNYLNSIEMYDPETNTSTIKASMSNARSNFTAVVLNGKIYAIGGYDGSGTYINSIEEYDPSTDTWTTKTPMNYSRSKHEAVVLNNKIYVIGGYAKSSENTTASISNTVEEYDPSANAWTIKEPMKDSRENHQVVVVDGTICCLGGDKGSIYYNSVEQYDPNTNVWTTKAPMRAKRTRLQAVAVENTIYALGGISEGSTSLGTAEKYTVEPATPTDPTAPINLTAIGGDSKIDLSWGAITEATSYNVYRSTTSGGPYTKIADGVNGTAYTDSDVTNGTTYYYVVTAVTADGESEYSNEASATPNKSGTEPEPEAGNTILEIYMVDGTEKEYELTSDKINEFLEWFDTRSEGSGKAYYVFEKTYNMGPYTSRDDYIIFDKIRDFEVNQYN